MARIGGEEFAWLMPETDQHGAYAAADRVRHAIESMTFEGVGQVTVSAGVCSTETRSRRRIRSSAMRTVRSTGPRTAAAT